MLDAVDEAGKRSRGDGESRRLQRSRARPHALCMREVEVVVATHNEGEAIAPMLCEFHRVAHQQEIAVTFIVSDDGSTDCTVEVILRLAQELPIRLLTSPKRKGYSRAVVDGLRAATAETVAFIDSEGSCDPRDFCLLVNSLAGADLVVGARSPRSDSRFRKLISGAFGFAYRRLFPVRLEDPSCPFIVVRRESLDTILAGNAGVLPQAFWWEFNARAAARGVRSLEVPVVQRATALRTPYRNFKLPMIALAHARGLLMLRRELARPVLINGETWK